MQILLKAGINLDQANAKGVTPLMNLKELKLKLAQKKIFLTLTLIPCVIPSFLCSAYVQKPSDKIEFLIKTFLLI